MCIPLSKFPIAQTQNYESAQFNNTTLKTFGWNFQTDV